MKLVSVLALAITLLAVPLEALAGPPVFIPPADDGAPRQTRGGSTRA